MARISLGGFGDAVLSVGVAWQYICPHRNRPTYLGASYGTSYRLIVCTGSSVQWESDALTDTAQVSTTKLRHTLKRCVKGADYR